MTLYADAYGANVYLLDVPAAVLDLPLADTDGADLSWIVNASALYVDPLGGSVPVDVAVASPGAAPHLAVTWPDPSLFTVAGLGWVLATVEASTPADGTQTVDPYPVAVEDPVRWLTIAGTRRLWGEAPEDPWELFLLLTSARSACIEYAPEIADGPLNPDYLQAQLVQARNTWEAVRAGGTDSLGSGEFAIPRHPLDWHVRALLRPRSTDARDTVT